MMCTLPDLPGPLSVYGLVGELAQDKKRLSCIHKRNIIIIILVTTISSTRNKTMDT